MNDNDYIREKYEPKAGLRGRERFWQIFVGLIVLLVSLGLFAVVYVIATRSPSETVTDIIGAALLLELYAIPASIALFLGLKYIMGPRSWLNRKIAESLKFLVILILVTSVFIVVLFLMLGRLT